MERACRTDSRLQTVTQYGVQLASATGAVPEQVAAYQLIAGQIVERFPAS